MSFCASLRGSTGRADDGQSTQGSSREDLDNRLHVEITGQQD